MTISVIPTPDTAVAVPRIRINVSSTAGSPSPVPNNSALEVFRIHPDGSRWKVIGESGDRMMAGSAVVFDYHPPFNVGISYLARAAGQESAAVGTIHGSGEAWLLNAYDPEKSLAPVYIADLVEDSLLWRGQLVDIPGNPYPVPRSFGVRGAGGGTLTIGVDPVTVPDVIAMVARSEPLLLNIPPRDGWPVSWKWIQPLDITPGADGTVDAPGGKAGYPYRTFTVPYRAIAQPTADLTPVWTDADLTAAYPTDALVIAAYVTDRGRTINVPGT